MTKAAAVNQEKQNSINGVPEILAPAGTMEALEAAVNAGCDAVYLGGTLFGARAYAGNFDPQELIKALDFCHLFDIRVYMTVNTLLKEPEIAQLRQYMEPYYKAGLDGVIVQDTGVIRVLHDAFPDLPLHGSTQMSICSVYGAQLLKDMGLKRVVPARELSLNEIRTIREQSDIEIETFVHGAMCYAYSGKCLFSSFLGGRSGNRGRCAQPCRQCYDMGHGVREYSMSMKDLCTLDVLPQLIDAGIHSFKIEGRMKNPSYVAGTVSAYKKARDLYLEMKRQNRAASCEELPESVRKEYRSFSGQLTLQLQDLYNRGGFHTGYYFPDQKNAFRGEKGLSMISTDRPNHIGSRVGTISKIKGPEVEVLLERDVHAQDVLEIFPAGVELTSPGDAAANSRMRLKARELNRIRAGMEVRRTRNRKLLQKIEQDLLQPEKKRTVHARILARIGEPLTIILSAGPGLPQVRAEGDIVQPSSGQPVSSAQLLQKMNKSGGTNLNFEAECIADDQAFVPMSRFNELRRTAAMQLKQMLCERYHREPHTRGDANMSGEL